MFDASCFALLVGESLGERKRIPRCSGLTLKELGILMFDASCFALLVEESLEVVRGRCGGKVTASFVFLMRLSRW